MPDDKYDFEIIFSGLCLFHTPPPEANYSGFDPAVILVNALKPRVSIDRKTYLHRHVPTLTFNPSDLDDFSMNVHTFESHFRLIPRGGNGGGEDTEDTMGVVDLEETLITIETHPADRQAFVAVRPERFPQNPDQREAGQRNADQPYYDENHLCWLPGLSAIDRRIRGLKRQCFADVVDNRLVTARLQLNQGQLTSSRLPRQGNDFVMWDFYPNQFPGRKTDYERKNHERRQQHHSDQKYFSVQQALADQVRLKFCNMEHPIRLRLDGRKKGFLVFPKKSPREMVGKNEGKNGNPKVTVNVGNLPTLPELPDTDVVTHFRWFYELVEWSSGLPTNLPAPRPTNKAVGRAAGGTFLCPETGSP